MEKNKISEKKLFTILAIDLFSLTGLIFPAVIVRFGGTNGLAGLLLASALAVFSGCYFLFITKNGRMSYDDAIWQLPSFARYGITGIYCVRFFMHGAFLLTVFASLIQETLLPLQKRGWILLPFLLLTFLAAGKSVSVRGSILEVLMPYIFVPLLIVLLLALFEVDYASLPEQIFGGKEGIDITSIYGMFLFFQPIEFLLFLAPCRKPESKKKGYAVSLACLFVIAVNILFYLVAVGIFGTVRTGDKLWSALYIMQSVRLPGHFVERLDILFLIFYIFSTFALFSGYLFYSENLLGVNEEGWKKKIYPVVYLAATFLVVLGISDPEKCFSYFISYKMWIDVPLAFGVPLLIRFVESMKKSGTKNYRSIGSVNKKSKKKKVMACTCLLCFIFLSGCQHKVDIEDRNYVISLSVEKDDKEKMKITYETADLTKGSGDSGGKSQGKTTTYTGDSLEKAEKKEENSDDKRVDYGHLKAILFQEEVLRDQTLWKRIVSELESKNGLAGTVFVFFLEEKPEEYMKLTKEWGTSFGEYLERMMSNHKTDAVSEYTLSELLREEAEGKHRKKVPVLSIKGEKIYVTEKTWEEELSPISQQVFRFHIRANSDSEKDQEFKTEVKNRILPSLQELFSSCDSKEECVEIAANHLGQIKEWVLEACKAVNTNTPISADVYLCREAFPVKQYGSLLLPSGTYDALRIDLGEGDGANWWCMMYPSLCMTDGVLEGVTKEDQKELEESLEKEEYDSLFFKEENKFHIKWRIPEVLEGIFGKKWP